MNRVFLTSNSQLWETPKTLIDELAKNFKWTLDACASRANVCTNFLNEEDDALTTAWGDSPNNPELVWMNSPYGRALPTWLDRAYEQSQTPEVKAVVCLLPARPDTRHFHENIQRCSYSVFIKGRLTFGSDEAWVVQHTERILKTDGQKCTNALGKLGGKLAGALVHLKAQTVLSGERYARWSVSDTLRKDAAPFPVMFMVFGVLTNTQRLALASLGAAMTLGYQWGNSE